MFFNRQYSKIESFCRTLEFLLLFCKFISLFLVILFGARGPRLTGICLVFGASFVARGPRLTGICLVFVASFGARGPHLTNICEVLGA